MLIFYLFKIIILKYEFYFIFLLFFSPFPINVKIQWSQISSFQHQDEKY